MSTLWLAVVSGTVAYLGLSAARIALAVAIVRRPERAALRGCRPRSALARHAG